MVKERPILFSGPMVRAILDGRKTQTRRVVKATDPNPARCITLAMLLKNVVEWRFQDGRWFGIEGYETLVFTDCPYGQVGERLWVREAWAEFPNPDGIKPGDAPCMYRADSSPNSLWKWKPSIHMPRSLSRITLEITGVRVERLNEITEEDAKAEGVSKGMACDNYSHVGHFQSLWESINGPGSWSANPWVWVIEFKRIYA